MLASGLVAAGAYEVFLRRSSRQLTRRAAAGAAFVLRALENSNRVGELDIRIDPFRAKESTDRGGAADDHIHALRDKALCGAAQLVACADSGDQLDHVQAATMRALESACEGLPTPRGRHPS